jgi:two-component sensor histidine kinase
VANVLAAAIERLRVEEELRASVEEKEVLLREVHHRVKNNLQAISNLLYLQSSYVDDGRITEIFREMRDRIKSIALIHERLYETNDLARINFAEYVQSLVDQLIHSYGVDPDHIKLEISIDEVSINVDMAIPLGVIINELVSNSIKHAFPAELKRPADEPNRIKVELSVQSDQSLLLKVSDNGLGFPLETDLAKTETLGLHLVRTLSSHIGGQIELDQSHGAAIKIRFSPPEWLAVQTNG